ncbi:MAG: DEAD/DEAH box helicase [Candidatus Latescibacterota bacterium]
MAPPDLLARFIQSFQRAIGAEMDAMRASLGPFEVVLGAGRAVGIAEEEPGRSHQYDFDLPGANDKLAVGLECSLRTGQSEYLVTLTRLEPGVLRLSSPTEIALDQGPCTLVLYPWFLYERLLSALGSLTVVPDLFPQSSLRLFGRLPVTVTERAVALPHPELNASQRRAVERCCRGDLAFVWGPPGTGKTRTLGHVVTELLHHGYRVLVTSTTNAAVDQALAKLAELPEARTYLNQGQVVRLGQVQGRTFGASLSEALERQTIGVRQQRQALEARLAQARTQAIVCRALLPRLDEALAQGQLELFARPRPNLHLAQAAAGLFGPPYRRHLETLDLPGQRAAVARRQARLERLTELLAGHLEVMARDLRQQEAEVVSRSRVVLATMTNVYLSRLLAPERFDAVIVEEAGMAILPTLFYCAALARDKVIMVGDPRQLPPIVQSRDPYVRQAMGRSIFAVTVPEPHQSDLVVLLEEQYRMHPVIGRLVSESFYQGRLRDGAGIVDRQALADRYPFPGQPLVVVDTAGETRCSTATGSYSRYNEGSADCCLALALAAVNDGLDSVAIITPYAEQARLVRRLLAQAGGGAARVECSTVHRFQGNERDLVILDTVDTEPLAPGVLLAGQAPGAEAAHLLNVSISRARGKLVILADLAYFRTRAPTSTVAELLGRAVRMGVVVTWTTVVDGTEASRPRPGARGVSSRSSDRACSRS